jgi:cytosine deaminase
MPLDVALRGARVRDDGPLVDIGIVGSRISSVAPAIDDTAPTEIACAGRVVLPGFVESHLHLDKAFLVDRGANHSGTLAEAIRVTGELKTSLTAEDISERAERALLLAVSHATTTIRAETEFDPVLGLMGIHALLDLKQRYAWAVDLQVVAFPQEGIRKTPGTEALFWQAMESGADVVGGVPYNDTSAEAHIDLCFDIARAYDRPLSFHQDFRDDADGLSIEYLARKTIAGGWQGRVEIGHATALGALPPERLTCVAELLREADISVVALPLTDLHLGGRADRFNVRRGLAPVKALLAAGVNVAVSTNNIRNAFTPYGNADLLLAAFLLLAVGHLGDAETLPHVLELVTTRAAQAIGLSTTDYGTAPGCKADLVVLETYRVADVMLDLPARLWVLKNGRVTVRTQVETTILAP